MLTYPIRGQALVEYALLIVLLAVAVLSALALMGQSIDDKVLCEVCRFFTVTTGTSPGYCGGISP
jgi:Flp pilus assembly pilin Flp